jgi:hypothetical protein
MHWDKEYHCGDHYAQATTETKRDIPLIFRGINKQVIYEDDED